MTTEVSTEVKSVKELVSDKIKAEFLNLIPKDQWDKMVSTEIDLFLEQKKGHYHNDPPKPSELQQLINAERKKQALTAVADVLLSSEWKSHMVEQGKLVAGEAVKKLVEDHASQMIASFFATIVSSHISNFAYTLQQQARG